LESEIGAVIIVFKRYALEEQSGTGERREVTFRDPACVRRYDLFSVKQGLKNARSDIS
jgi:hypothetical protein